jgi:hypothetical protein
MQRMFFRQRIDLLGQRSIAGQNLRVIQLRG